MFEVITQANPDDYQSLEILKEAYWKIGRTAEGLVVTRRLADTYMKLGQYSSALLEYEGILQQEPDSKEVQQILDDLEAKLHQGKSSSPTSKPAAIALDFGIDDATELESPKPALASDGAPALKLSASPGLPTPEPGLVATASTALPKAANRRQANVSLDVDGNEPLAKFLIQHRLASHEVVNAALAQVHEHNFALKPGQQIAASLLDEIAKAGVDIEALMAGIVDRTKFAYIPLECYDVDRQIVKMLPDNLTLGRLVVPFDIVSRTMMVAIDNPFDAGAKNAVQQSVDYHVQWHLAMPSAIQKVLRDTYRISA